MSGIAAKVHRSFQEFRSIDNSSSLTTHFSSLIALILPVGVEIVEPFVPVLVAEWLGEKLTLTAEVAPGVAQAHMYLVVLVRLNLFVAGSHEVATQGAETILVLVLEDDDVVERLVDGVYHSGEECSAVGA